VTFNLRRKEGLFLAALAAIGLMAALSVQVASGSNASDNIATPHAAVGVAP
jgi:hypothetical protein